MTHQAPDRDKNSASIDQSVHGQSPFVMIRLISLIVLLGLLSVFTFAHSHHGGNHAMSIIIVGMTNGVLTLFPDPDVPT